MPDRPVSTYRELAPPPALAPYVVCLWSQEITGPADAGAYRQPVLPDGCTDIVFTGGRLVVAGPATRPFTTLPGPGSTSVGVRFRPGAAPPLLGASAAELRDLEVPLDGVWSRPGRTLAERLAETPDVTARLDLLAGVLAGRRADAPAADPVATGVARLLALHPGASLPWLADQVGLSERQVRRRVEEAVGYPPRTLGRILRFQRFLAAWRALPPDHRDLARLAAEAGYADQAHLTRETRRLAGLPPAALLAWEASRLAPTPNPTPA
jgi:AraC-like DNA-binding protein